MEQLDAFIFLEMVEGKLLWEEQKADPVLERMAWFTANLLMASGNMKKNTDVIKLKKDLYESLNDRMENKPKPKTEQIKDVMTEKEKLKAKFNL